MHPPIVESNRYEHIDALRAIAALMVIACHTTETMAYHFSGIYIESFFSGIVMPFDFGRAGVVLFFAISGFVIPGSLKPHDPVYVFPIRRFFRLYPAFWISILTGLAGLHWAWGQYPDVGSILINVTMLQRFFGSADILGLYWTLQVELFFYFVCFLLALAGLLDKGWLLSGLALFLGLYWYFILATGLGLFPELLFLRPDWSGYYLEWTAYLSIMFLGAGFRSIARGNLDGAFAFVLAMLLWLLVQPLTGYYLHRNDIAKDFVAQKYGAYAIGLWAFLIFGFVLKIRGKAAAWLGRISYSLYLQHPFVIYGLVWVILRMQWSPSLTAGEWLLVVAAATTGFAALLYYLVEAPSIALSNRLISYLAEVQFSANFARTLSRLRASHQASLDVAAPLAVSGAASHDPS